MSNYVKSTDFAAKDALASGNAGKIVKGTEIDTEFNNIATAVATKADLASPTFTGTVAAGTANITTLTASTATISGGTITGITDLAIADGGTGASTAANARSNLGTVSDTASNGIAARTAANTLTARTITAGTGITVADGDGVSGNPTIANSGVTSVNSSTGAITVSDAKVWVNFNGTGTVAIRASFNVSSISDNGAGDFSVNFTNALTDADYAVVANACSLASWAANAYPVLIASSQSGVSAPSSAAIRIAMRAATNNPYDPEYVTLIVFR